MCRHFIWHGKKPRTWPSCGCKNKKSLERGLSQWKPQHLGGPAAACVGLAAAVSAWRGWLNPNRYRTRPPWDRALGRGTDRNSLAEKARANPVRRDTLRRGSLRLKHWESSTAVVWRFLQLLIYLSSPSVMKIPDLKKLSRNNSNNNKKAFARIRAFCGDQIKFFQCVPSVHRPSLDGRAGDDHTALTTGLLARLLSKKQVLRLVPEQRGGVGRKSFPA